MTKAIFFWRESDEAGWLCQWFHHPFRDDEDPERVYFTAEQCVWLRVMLDCCYGVRS